mmetsp:Transcript_9934/g.1560  ORF Transcript_9934/g.1560 Transcript_9934/m.1560 type:complete len:93 (+) Transcript_9934:169-447(+)
MVKVMTNLKFAGNIYLLHFNVLKTILMVDNFGVLLNLTKKKVNMLYMIQVLKWSFPNKMEITGLKLFFLVKQVKMDKMLNYLIVLSLVEKLI